jgi:membrane associated rhomboid family serine protease
MIPLRDRNPSGRFPLVTLLLIIANAAVFIYQLSLQDNLRPFFYRYALIPAEIFSLEGTPGIPEKHVFLSFITSMFLHGGWLHVIGNMWYLWIFGDNIDDRLGLARLMVLFGVRHWGSLGSFILNRGSAVPGSEQAAPLPEFWALLYLFPFARVSALVHVSFTHRVEIHAVYYAPALFVLPVF